MMNKKISSTKNSFFPKNHKASASLVFLVVSILVVSSGLVLTVNELTKPDNENIVRTGRALFNNIGGSFGFDEVQKTEVDSENSFSGGGGGGSKKKSSSSSSNTPTNIGLLKKYETNYEQFKEIEIQDKTVFFYQRMIGEAIVEKDFKVYQFDKNTGKFLKTNINWRDDLSEDLLPSTMISKEQAESMVEGEVQFSQLYIISPESDVFLIKPTPENPSWVVRSIEEDRMIITIIDSVDGEILGYGIPPPSSAFSFTGPYEDSPCYGGWYSRAENARDWFDIMGYNTEYREWPTKSDVEKYVESPTTFLFYEIAHGGSTYFKSGCKDGNYEITYVNEIESWINIRGTPMPFTFLASCNGMCDTGPGKLSDAFRKGSDENTVTVGYCGMSSDNCSVCWGYSLAWQSALFNYMNHGDTVKIAFDKANAKYPTCRDNNCMRFAGDVNFKVVSCETEWSINNYCKDNDVYHNKTCSNLIGSTWLKEEEKIEDCGEDEYSDNYCYEEDVYKDFIDKGCSSNSCFEKPPVKQKVEECIFGCVNGECNECSSNLDCGTDDYVGGLFCQEDDVWQDYITYTCNNAGELATYCSNSTTPKLNESCGFDYCEDWQDNYCEAGNIYHERICHDKGCSNGACFDNTYVEEEKVQDCGEDEYGDNYCYEEDVYRDFTDRGCSSGSCFETTTKQLVEDCEYGCENSKCKKPDLIIENFYYNGVAFLFKIKNVGNAIADPVYWMVDTNSPDANPERTTPASLEPGKFTLGGFPWTYSQSGNYAPKVIVDFDNLIDESNEDNNEMSILVSV